MVLKSRIRPSAVTVTTTATLLPTTALPGRQSIDIQNNGAATLYIGDSTVTVNNGRLVLSGASYPMDVGEHVSIYGIVASGTVNVRVLEGV